jgi:hypothetical protein
VLKKILAWLHDHHIPVRLSLAVVAGIVSSKILTVITHEAFHNAGMLPALGKPLFDLKELWLAMAFHSLYAVLSAMLTAHLAQNQIRKAVIILGSKEAILWALGIILLWKDAPAWYNIMKAVTGIPLAMLGGMIYVWLSGKKVNILKKQKR